LDVFIKAGEVDVLVEDMVSVEKLLCEMGREMTLRRWVERGCEAKRGRKEGSENRGEI
jgi:hypothetical protein